MNFLPAFFVFCITTMVVSARRRDIFALDKRWICNVKNTCLECLRLPHCSWCQTEQKCFSRQLPNNVCSNDTVVDHKDYGLSIEENAECSCEGGKMELNCYPPGVTDGPECSGRGQCICGHCVCDTTPDLENPTKTVMGEHCEFDNFSCDGPKCNEGPYSISEPVAFYDDIDNTDGSTDDTPNKKSS